MGQGIKAGEGRIEGGVEQRAGLWHREQNKSISYSTPNYKSASIILAINVDYTEKC
jgi:hypothetical protein